MTGQALKFFAMATMLMDHLTAFFPQVFPLWFRWFGRLSAPIFMFCITEGLRHTSNQKNYLTRLYVFSVIMGVMDVGLNLLYPTSLTPMTNNIMSTFFLVGIFVVLINRIQKKEPIKGINPVVVFIIFVVLQLILSFAWIYIMMTSSMNIAVLFSAIIPNIMGVEGSTFFLLVGIIMYYSSNAAPNKRTMVFSVTYGALCAYMLFTSITLASDISYIFMGNYQWMMIGSLPFILLYNGKRGIGGKGLKYLFYCFYPAHLALLFLLSTWTS